MRFENRLTRLEERIAPRATGDAKKRLDKFLANKCESVRDDEITEAWLDSASPADVLAAGMKHAQDLPPVLEERLRGLAKGDAPVAAISRNILEARCSVPASGGLGPQ